MKELVKSMAQLKRELKNNKENLYFKTIENEFKPDRIGIERQVGEDGTVQGNAFTLETNVDGKIVHSWVWFNENTLTNGIMAGKDYNIKMEVYIKN